jgi:hypothetical protein
MEMDPDVDPANDDTTANTVAQFVKAWAQLLHKSSATQRAQH